MIDTDNQWSMDKVGKAVVIWEDELKNDSMNVLRWYN